MSIRGNRIAAAAAGVALALAVSPVASATTAAACTWQKTTWELPTGAEAGSVTGYDGSRYAVGVTGRKGQFGTIGSPRGTVWDSGRVVLRITGDVPHLRDVNSSGLVVGDTVDDNGFRAITVTRDGSVTTLPGNPTWSGYTASLINNRGDVVGAATTTAGRRVVVWPASAPGTYRELPTPTVSSLFLTDVDEQGRIIAQTDSGSGGGFVWDTDGQYRVVAATGAGGWGTPWAIRDGRVVGSVDSTSAYAAAEWNARGALTRVIRDGALVARAIGGAGTVAGIRFVGSTQRPVLWRSGVVSDALTSVAAGFSVRGVSNDERTLVGTENRVPSHYSCS
ncbi:hypothetical protein ABZ816_34460 [Actinosynnema sp. NPDC047251]|uniref:hypothetical protein n=1 Tax=Saccharothrix espanaensis TaxID=103731 RepID=UPI0011DDC97B|nr:hypothetical protein [Saccharothrix espanaensis]